MSHWIVRHYYAGSAVIAVMAGLLVLLVLEPLGAPLTVEALLFFLILLAWATLYVVVCKRLGEAAVHALEEGCDPEPLLALSREQLANRSKGRGARRPTSLACRLNAAAALTSLGRDGEALEELDALGGLLSPRPDRFHVLYALDRAAICFHLGRPREMRDLLERAESLLGTLTLPQAVAGSCRFVLRTNRAACRYLTEGPLPELEEQYRALLSEAATRRMKVGFHLALGKFALARNDEAEARAHLTYAAGYGNKLCCRAEAERLLAGLSPGP